MVNEDTVKNKITRRGSKKALRTDVGTRNPYALVDQKLGVRIDWMQTPLKGRKKMVREYIGIPFQKLFTPGYESLISGATGLSQKTRRVNR